ncbi:MBL fold metallo-hydrolase [Lysinibacillus antri]|uniref:MBL fold metallo-hydrolase n=1 Tax=Lysinibacillus antri TaxID=2498145 RepID=A0A3S0PRY8_9BACI|nr:MBL fold metallo-hydrolase [Lysinibacillus antri]RUL56374.1 MBL fold metallo-hydrolase [Lysinibacillus antri]
MQQYLYLLIIALILTGCTEKETVQLTPDIETSGKDMLIHFIDVGQGDSIFIQTPNGETMLVDGGTRSAGQEVVAYLQQQNVKQLNYIVATHPDADHIGGLIPVLNAIPVHNFIDSGKVHTSQTYEDMLSLIQTKKIPFSVAHVGDTVPLDEDLNITVISADETASDNNEASVVLKVTYNDISLLLTGDAGVELEEQMLTSKDIQATILKAGHHGSNTSSSLPFLQAVQPEVTILSYGQNNSYGHPHLEVIEYLRQVGSKIYGTAESGSIVITTDGKNYEVLAEEWTGSGASSSIPKRNSNQTNDVIIQSKDVENEVVAIMNRGLESVNMLGWQLLSVEGNQLFNFPNVTIQPGKTLYITSGTNAKEGNNYMKWTSRQIWLNSGDAAQLIDPKGEVVSEFQ